MLLGPIPSKVSKVISGIPKVLNSRDNIMIGGRNLDQQKKSLAQLLQTLEDHKLTLQREKCEFGEVSIDFHGHLFTQEGLKPSPTKIQTVQNCAPPASKEELVSFLQMVAYLSRYISNFFSLCEPLRKLTKVNAKFEWSTEQEKACQDLKATITAAALLILYHPECETLIICDRSPEGLGGGLFQKTGKGFQPVHYASWTLTDTEKRYSQIKREALAAKFTTTRLQMYLLGAPKFKLATDHKALLQQSNSLTTTTHWKTHLENEEPQLQNDSHPWLNQHDWLHVQTPIARDRNWQSWEICHRHSPIRACCSPGQNQRNRSQSQSQGKKEANTKRNWSLTMTEDTEPKNTSSEPEWRFSWNRTRHADNPIRTLTVYIYITTKVTGSTIHARRVIDGKTVCWGTSKFELLRTTYIPARDKQRKHSGENTLKRWNLTSKHATFEKKQNVLWHIWVLQNGHVSKKNSNAIDRFFQDANSVVISVVTWRSMCNQTGWDCPAGTTRFTSHCSGIKASAQGYIGCSGSTRCHCPSNHAHQMDKLHGRHPKEWKAVHMSWP